MATLQTFGGGTTDFILDPGNGAKPLGNAPYTVIDGVTMLPASGLTDANGVAVTQLTSDADGRYAGSALLEGSTYWLDCVGSRGPFRAGPQVSTTALANVVAMGPQLNTIAASAAASAFSAKQAQAAAEAVQTGSATTNASLLTSGTVPPARLPDLSGTYATAAAVAGKVGKGDLVVNVRDFGAKGDGTTDDTAAVQAAIDTAATAGASGAIGVVIVPSGTYLCTPLVLKSRVALRGQGSATIKHKGTGGYVGNFPRAIITSANQPAYKDPAATDRVTVTAAATDLSIEDITFDGAGNHVYGVQMVACDRVHLSRLTIQNASGGTDFRAIRYSTFTDCTIVGISEDGFSVTDQNFAAAVKPNSGLRGISERLLFERCVVRDSQTSNGLGTSSMNAFEMDDGMSDVTFRDCRALNSRGSGFKFHIHTAEYDIADIHFVNCVTLNCTPTAGDDRQVAGFEIGQCPSGSFLGRITYKDCTSIGSPNAFARTPGAESGTVQSVSITGGYWKSLPAEAGRGFPRSTCIYVGKQFDDFKIRGATIAGAQDGFGIYTYSTAGSLSVSDTTMVDSYTPLYLGATGGTVGLRGVRVTPGVFTSVASSVCVYVLTSSLQMSDVTLVADQSKYTSSLVRLISVAYARVGATVRNTGAVGGNAFTVQDGGMFTFTGCVVTGFTNGIFLSGAQTSTVSAGNTFKGCTAKYNTVPATLVDSGNAV